ncbi:MAG TPA: c-type cytochrome, partial [Gemmataceae bacterium]|nr:c-type cytochrome [Gemmataceae bacterium]
MFRLRRPWVVLFSVWFGAAVIGSFMGCSENAKTDTAPPPPPPKKTSTQTVKDKPGVVEPDTTPKVVEPTAEIIAKFQPGLALKFVEGGGADAKVLDARGIRMAALQVPSGAAQSTMLPAGPFHALLSGYIKQNLNGECSFKLVGLGNAKLYINGKMVASMTDGVGKDSAVVPLKQGYNQIDVRYAGPTQGDATLRVYWKSDEQNSSFSWEPLQPNALFARGDDDSLIKGQDEREGRLLFATLNCAQCHGLPGKLKEDSCKMPELKQRGPSLENAGQRFQQDWLVEWIVDPQSLRPEATMPHVLHGPDAQKEAADIAAYLGTQKEGLPLPATKEDGEQAERGQKLYQTLGCAACHHLEEPAEDKMDEFGRLSLYYVNAKYAPG